LIQKFKDFPRISTRGFFDLQSGRKLKRKYYDLFPKIKFHKFQNISELVIMVHGLRNRRKSALGKFVIAEKRLFELDYKFPVIGYTYDSDTVGIFNKKTQVNASKVAQKIAMQNGNNLAKFVLEYKSSNPNTKIRLIGHSLGSQVIFSALKTLSKKPTNKNIIESIHLFGAAVSQNYIIKNNLKEIIQTTVHKKIINFYNPFDKVLEDTHKDGTIKNPLGLFGFSNKIPKIYQKKIFPKDHRFISYVVFLKSFP